MVGSEAHVMSEGGPQDVTSVEVSTLDEHVSLQLRGHDEGTAARTCA